MCQVCIDWEKGKMKDYEALKAIGEMIESENTTEEQFNHYLDVEDKLLDSMDEDKK